MKLKKAKALTAIFEQADSDFPDKSTAFLLEVSAERARHQGYHDTDCGDIAEALFLTLPKTKP